MSVAVEMLVLYQSLCALLDLIMLKYAVLVMILVFFL